MVQWNHCGGEFEWKYNGEIQTKQLSFYIVSSLLNLLTIPLFSPFSSRSYECMNELRLVRPIATRFFWMCWWYAPCFRKEKNFSPMMNPVDLKVEIL